MTRLHVSLGMCEINQKRFDIGIQLQQKTLEVSDREGAVTTSRATSKTSTHH
jgi:hypothetical protein